MKIAIDISPIQGEMKGHKVRGIGFYLTYLKQSLLTYFPQHQYIFFTDPKEIPLDADLVHYPYFDPFFLTLPLRKKHKTVVTVHDLTPLVFPQHFPAGIKGSLRWQIQKLALRQTDAIITDSETSKKDILRLAGIPEKKISVVYLAAAEEFKKISDSKSQIAKLKSKYHLPEKFFLYVGDVTWNKNLPRLVQAIQSLDIPLVMVGKALIEKEFDKTNPWNKSLVKFHKLIKNDNNIIRLGFIPTEDVVTLYNAAVLFAMPSLYEGFGLPIIEAMQSGCPIVTTEEGSLWEVAGSAAFFVDGEDYKSIARAIKKLFSDEQLQKRLSDKGLEQAKQFSWKKTAAQTIEVYEKVIT